MPSILESILTRKVSIWNRKVFLLDDIISVCEAERLPFIEDPELKCQGEYGIYYGRPYIAVKKSLKPEKKLWVGSHELGHHFLHYPVNHRFSKSILRRMDREANFFAAIALMPTYIIKKMTFGAIFEEYNYPPELIQIRKDIWEAYRI